MLNIVAKVDNLHVERKGETELKMTLDFEPQWQRTSGLLAGMRETGRKVNHDEIMSPVLGMCSHAAKYSE